MPWVAAVGAVASAGIGSASSNSAAKKQQGATDRATDLQADIYRSTVERNSPFVNAGTDVLGILQQRLPALTTTYDPTQLLSEPGYQFGLRQGQEALERSLAARGRGVSGAAFKAASEYGTNFGTTKLNDAFSRDMQGKQSAYNMLMGLVGTGQASANNTAAAGQQFASQAGSNIIGAGNAAAANSLAQGNLWGGLLNQGASMYGRSQYGTTGAGYSGATDYNQYGTTDFNGQQVVHDGYADGGPVVLKEVEPGRYEPKVGTKAPRRKGGTGSGLSRDAVLAALDTAWQEGQQPQQRSGVAALPTNPVTNPGGLRRAQMQQLGLRDGGAVRSKTGGKADKVNAKLSGGEHVIDAEVVAMLGDGNSEAGHALLEELKQRVREFKRQVPADRPALALGE